MVRAGVILLVATCVVFVSASTRPGVVEALDAYAIDPASVVRSVAGDDSLSSTTASLRRDGTTWMLSHGAADANRRRLIAATFALEVAGTGIESQQKDVPALVEWGCEQIRRRLPSDAERQWHIAALALLEGLGNLQAVETHLAHASSRLADEPMWDRARVWIADSRTFDVHPRQPLSASKIAFPSALAAEYAQLSRVPSLAGDAWLRIGFLHFLSGANADARSAFARSLSSEADTDTQYLAHLFTAWTFEREQRRDASVPSLVRALDVAPHGRTAAVWLANARVLAGSFSDAEAIAERGLRTDADRIDPWRLFYGGDIRRWPSLVTSLRVALQ